ncbi:hypothetical protein ACA910_016872 [Epithemia clementina (nom. ined.)]
MQSDDDATPTSSMRILESGPTNETTRTAKSSIEFELAQKRPKSKLYKVLVWKSKSNQRSNDSAIRNNNKNKNEFSSSPGMIEVPDTGTPSEEEDLVVSIHRESNDSIKVLDEEAEPLPQSRPHNNVVSGAATTQVPKVNARSPSPCVDDDTAIITKAVSPGISSSATVQSRTKTRQPIKDAPVSVVPPSCFNVVLTHATADFDSLASAVGLAKLWTSQGDNTPKSNKSSGKQKAFFSASHVPTFVVLPRGAHPAVQRFLALHKHLFPIRSLKSLPEDLSGLNRLALVDAQRRDRLGPAEGLLEFAKRIVVVDHHVDQESDIPATDYVVDKVGSVSALVSEYLKEEEIELTEAEATLLALGIHGDTGSLCFDSTTPRDARALAWCLEQGASQAAIAEHAQTSLSHEQQSVLTQALININSTQVHGISLSTVLLSADGFINGLAAVTQDALELSSSDIFLLGMVYEPHSRRRRKGQPSGRFLTGPFLTPATSDQKDLSETGLSMANTDAWKGGTQALRRRQLRAAFDRKDIDSSGYLERGEISAALATCGVIASEQAVANLMADMDANGDGKISFEEFVKFAQEAEKPQEERGSSTLIIVGRVKAGVNLKSVKLNKLLERFGGGGHAKAASATVRLNEAREAADIMQGLVDELIETNLQEQPTVGDFMTAPALSIKANMNEKQVEDLLTRYDVRALPVVDDDNNVIGLVTYKEVASVKQRLWNKEQKRLRREQEAQERGEELSEDELKLLKDRRASGTTVKAWMKQHVRTVEASKTMAEVESILLENDVGCIPVVADGTERLVGMVTRTDLLRQHRYYASLHYHNKGFADSIANRRSIIELRKRLKKFDDLDG